MRFTRVRLLSRWIHTGRTLRVMPSRGLQFETLLQSFVDGPTHVEVEDALRAAGWMFAGAGDWAIALRSPDGVAAARISPFDPAGPYTAALYRDAAATGQVPALYVHRRLAGGGDLQIMEWLDPVSEDVAETFHRAIADRAPEVAILADVIARVHRRAQEELPWCGPLDNNPSNVMRAADGHLVVTDLFYADGPNLYAAAATDPDLVVARIPADDRRYITEIPLASSGGWQPGAKAAIQAALLAAERRLASTDASAGSES